jgi:hypothetical protein
MRFMVHDIIRGEDAITLDDGQSVYDRIYPELRAGREVDLDFLQVSVLASPFFNAAIGQLLRDLSSDELNRLLRVTNLTPVGANVMRQVIANAKRYYAEPDYRRAVTEVLTALAAEA